MAYWTLIAFGAYLRPGEALRLRGVDLSPPVPPTTTYWTLLVCPEDLGTPSKVGEFDDAVVWDHSVLQWLTPFFRDMTRREDACIWDFTYAQLVREFARTTAELGIRDLVPYSLRHSGASHDALVKVRPLLAIQKRGRWRCYKSVARYEKAGRVTVEFNKLPCRLRRWCQDAAAVLPMVAMTPSVLREPPVAPTAAAANGS